MLTPALFAAAVVSADDPETAARIVSPVPHEIVQREGFVPERAYENNPGGPTRGYANLPIRAVMPVPMTAIAGLTYEYRVVRLKNAWGADVDWTAFKPSREGVAIQGIARVPAGGWYRLEVRERSGDSIKQTAAVEPVGVGEIFVIAGQSYAEGTNEERLKIADPEGRVSAFDAVKGTWRVANDPQPNVADGGTIWPPFAEALQPMIQVPIGFVNVAVGGTASRQWMPGEKLYQNLLTAGKSVKRFRAVLWQQGESDVIENIAGDVYRDRIITIRTSLVKEWGFEPIWMPAKSTLHPTVYKSPDREAVIRDAIGELWKTPGFAPGPDTDVLGGPNRAPLGTRRHFTGAGQKNAGLLWFAAAWQAMNHPPANLPKPSGPATK